MPSVPPGKAAVAVELYLVEPFLALGQTFFFIHFCLSCPSPDASRANALLDDFIRPVKHRLWDRQADQVCCLEVDDKLELCRLFDG
jgi:hypothetical protein